MSFPANDPFHLLISGCARSRAGTVTGCSHVIRSWTCRSSKPLDGNHLSRVIAIFLLLLCSQPGFAASAKERPVIGTPKIGWDGHYLVGRWTRIVVPITVAESSAPVQLELTAVDSDGNRVHFRSAAAELAAGEHLLTGYVKIGRLDSDITIRVNEASEIRGSPGRTKWLEVPLLPSTQLIVTVGDPPGFDFETESSESSRSSDSGRAVKLARIKANELPTDPIAYDGVSSVVIAGTNEFSPAQVVALREWVATGGRMVLSLHQNFEIARRMMLPFAEWNMPISVGDQPVTVREFGGLESFARKNIHLPQTSTLSIPNLRCADGEVLAASRTDAFLVHAPYGVGSIMVLAMDLTSAPLREWKALPSFCANLCEVRLNADALDKGQSKGSQLSTTGITDLATQLNATQDHFDNLHRASPWHVLGLLLGLLFVVGPLDYLFVHRILKKPHFTWISYPILVAGCGLLASWLANSTNGSTRHANQLDIMTVDIATGRATGRHFVTLYSPVTTQSSIALKPLPLIDDAKVAPTTSVVWQGIPEPTFGGMLRKTSLEQGADYQRQPDGELINLPLLQWSSKALVAESSQSVEGLVDCSLKASATGRLTGTIRHRLPVAIEDWILVYKNVVYRHLKQRDDPQPLPLPPNQIFRVEQPRVFTREIRPYMTGMITMATPRFGQSNISDYSSHQTNYDVLSRDPAMLVRTMTFHDEIGADRYTGLTNQLLNDEDCSHLLKLGRAILFGRIKHRVAVIHQDQTTLEPDRESTFIRLILPVARPTEVIKELQRVFQ